MECHRAWGAKSVPGRRYKDHAPQACTRPRNEGRGYKLKISDLLPDTQNANKGTKRGNKAVADSLKLFGAGRSILVDKAGRIIAGNKTAANAAAAGLDEVILVPSDGTKIIAVQRIDLDLNDPKAKELAIADNRAAELGLEWDPEVLAKFSTELDLKPFFTDAELKDILPSSAADLDGSEDEVPAEPEGEPQSKPGDLYVLGNHRLLCGDATSPDDVDRLLDGTTPDMVFTDPPYGISIADIGDSVIRGGIMGDETTDAATAAFHLCAAMNVPLFFWGANHYAADAKLPNASCWVCWDKQEANNHIDQSDCEFAWTNIKGPARIFHHLWSGFRRDSEKGERRVHPTQKPVALLVEILDFFNAGKNILDLFGGSGSTLIACGKSNRNCYMMELDPRYVDVIVKRWEQATGKKAELYGRS